MSKEIVRRGRKFIEYHDPETQDANTFTQEISGADVSYQDEAGNWQASDENWAADGLDGYIAKADKMNHKIRIKGTGGRAWYPRRNVSTEYLTFGVPQYWTGSKWSNFGFSGWSVEGKTITLNTRQGVTILVHSRWNGIKIDWVLASSSAPTRMRYQVGLTGITEIAGVLFGADGERLGELTPTTATDSTFDEMGEPTQLPCSGSYSGGYVEFQADVSGAVYPVTIDPDFSGTSTAGDVHFRQYDGFNTSNFGQSTAMYFIYNNTALFRFDLSSISSSNTATAVSLAVKILGGTVNSDSTFDIYSISEANGDWIEGTGTSGLAASGEPCFNAKEADGSGGITTAWAGGPYGCSQAADRESTLLGTQSRVSGTIDTPETFTETFNESGIARVTNWFSGTNTNYGLLFIKSAGSVGSTFRLGSSENATESYRPVLTVTYTTAGTFIPINMSAQMQSLTGGMRG